MQSVRLQGVGNEVVDYCCSLEARRSAEVRRMHYSSRKEHLLSVQGEGPDLDENVS